MFKNIAFIGGIHGAGKSTICNNLCESFKINYLSASKVIKWAELNDDLKNKKVTDIPLTQNLLIEGLKKSVLGKEYYLLDGHYCLLNKDSKITKIPFETFEAINPFLLLLITDDINEIKSRLELRDKKTYEYSLLEDMQNSELAYAKELSYKLGVELSIGSRSNFAEITKSISAKIPN